MSLWFPFSIGRKEPVQTAHFLVPGFGRKSPNTNLSRSKIWMKTGNLLAGRVFITSCRKTFLELPEVT